MKQPLLPTFREPMPPRPYHDPIETYDFNEPRPFEWRDLADPTLIVSAAIVVFASLLVLAYVFTAGPA